MVANVDDRQTPVEFGPSQSDGGFTMGIMQKRKGKQVLVATITGSVQADGTLTLSINPQVIGKDEIILSTDP